MKSLRFILRQIVASYTTPRLEFSKGFARSKVNILKTLKDIDTKATKISDTTKSWLVHLRVTIKVENQNKDSYEKIQGIIIST